MTASPAGSVSGVRSGARSGAREAPLAADSDPDTKTIPTMADPEAPTPQIDPGQTDPGQTDPAPATDPAPPPSGPERLGVTIERTKQIVDVIRRGKTEGVSAPEGDGFREKQRQREREEAERHSYAVRRERLNEAWRTVPYSFRWARFGETLSSRVKPVAAIARARTTIEDFAAGRGSGSMVLLGPTEAGKTSLAVACLRWFVQEAERVARHPPLTSDSERRVYRLGAGARFITAYDLAKAAVYSQLGRRPELVEQALSATVLVIDELGMDVDVYRHSATSVSEVIHERHAEHRPTIVTTYLTEELIKKQYGAGIARRIFEGTRLVLRKESG